VDDLIPNQIEVVKIARQSGAVSVVKAVQALHSNLGAKRIIVTLGSRGALISDPACGRKALPTYDVNAIDTTAAGDAFIGAYAVAITEGKDCAKAVEWDLPPVPLRSQNLEPNPLCRAANNSRNSAHCEAAGKKKGGNNKRMG